jgi:hypothetical protein
VEFIEGRIESLPLPDATVDCVISNGVINLAPTSTLCSPKQRGYCVRADAWRSPTASPRPLTEAIVCNADLWASCIGGAAEQETYLQAIESAGFTIDTLRVNAYAFLSDQARNASAKSGVKSISLLATKSAH